MVPVGPVQCEKVGWPNALDRECVFPWLQSNFLAAYFVREREAAMGILGNGKGWVNCK
jgi:hypothetical protein